METDIHVSSALHHQRMMREKEKIGGNEQQKKKEIITKEEDIYQAQQGSRARIRCPTVRTRNSLKQIRHRDPLLSTHPKLAE